MPDEETTETAESEIVDETAEDVSAETETSSEVEAAANEAEAEVNDAEVVEDDGWVEQLPEAEVLITYLGPVAPHWDIQFVSGDEALVDAFRHRVDARLMLLPQHDPQWRRNRERVDRDAERELIAVTWELED